MIPKNIPVRNRALLDLAHRLNQCTLNIPGVCTGYSVEGLEPAHSNWAEDGKGKSLKAHDNLHAAACHACHAELDQGNKLSREERQWYWNRGHKQTMTQYWRNGWLAVKG